MSKTNTRMYQLSVHVTVFCLAKWQTWNQLWNKYSCSISFISHCECAASQNPRDKLSEKGPAKLYLVIFQRQHKNWLQTGSIRERQLATAVSYIRALKPVKTNQNKKSLKQIDQNLMPKHFYTFNITLQVRMAVGPGFVWSSQVKVASRRAVEMNIFLTYPSPRCEPMSLDFHFTQETAFVRTEWSGGLQNHRMRRGRRKNNEIKAENIRETY